jgi:hypothetical protein
MNFLHKTHFFGPLTFTFHFVECGMGWSKWYYGLRLVWKKREVFRLRVKENKNHWSYKIGKGKDLV